MEIDPVQQRQPEGQRLARSGLGLNQQVTALLDSRDGERLDRCGRGVAHLGQTLEQLATKMEGTELGALGGTDWHGPL